MNVLYFTLIGITAGAIMGFMGVGAGVIIVPALVYLAGFSQTSAVGTSLAILLPPLGLAAVHEYYRNGQVDLRAAIIIACIMIFSSWVTSRFALKINPSHLKLCFGSFIILIGIYMIYSEIKNQ